MKPKGDGVLITGATGVIGSYLAARAHREGHDVVCLMRTRGSLDQSRSAFRASLGTWMPETEPPGPPASLRVVIGDVRQPRCGLRGAASSELAGTIDQVWHCAADTTLAPSRSDDLERVNVDGTRNVLDLAADLGVRRTFLLSTLFVAGGRERLVGEELVDTDAVFRNRYEASKAAAERVFMEALSRQEECGAVLRLPLVLGDSQTGVVRRLTGFFAIAKVLHSLKPLFSGNGAARDAARRARLSLPITIEGEPDATMNVLPIDIVARTIFDVTSAHAGPARIYHVANGTPPTVASLVSDGLDYLGISDVRVSPHANGESLGASLRRLQHVVNEGVAPYRDYISGEPRFSRSSLERLVGRGRMPDFEIGPDYIRRVLGYCIARDWRLA